MVDKPDKKEIVEFINSLNKSPWLSSSQKWWPDYLFHFTDIRNAIKILGDGFLLNRNALKKSGEMLCDNASPEIIGKTDEKWKNYVRIYFRPQTPTQYCNEGIRPQGQLKYDSHCPIPIIFLFDSKSILTMKDTYFSTGNIASRAPVGHDSKFLKNIPFREVYHEGSFNEFDKSNIIFRRHAEVLVPSKLDLSYLKEIWCRSHAEYETLRTLLPFNEWKKYSKTIGTDTNKNLYFRKWTFIEKVDLTRESIAFHFNKESQTPGPFHIKFEITNSIDVVYKWEKENYKANDMLRIDISNVTHSEIYSVKLYLDEYLVYANEYYESDMPFK